MKLNLGCGNDIREGYINVEAELFGLSKESSAHESLKLGDARRLEWLCKSGEVEEILALNILDFCRHTELDKILENWVDKLKVGGVLKIATIDTRSLCAAYLSYQISPEDFVTNMHGLQDCPKNTRKSSLDILTIETKFKKLRLEILVSKVEKGQIYVEAEKC